MSGSRIEAFRRERERLNERVLATGTLEIKRFFALDTQAYKAGALDAKTKELLGLSASMVLRCDDCIAYHVLRACEEGATDDEIQETFAIGLIVGGSIVIPHLRRAVDLLDEARGRKVAPPTARPGTADAAGAGGTMPPHDHGAGGHAHG